MTAIIGQIIQGFKAFLSKLEEMAQYAVSKISKYSSQVAQELQVLMQSAFRTIKDKISKIIKAFRSKIESIQKKRTPTTVGPSASSFSIRIQIVVKDGNKNANNVSSKYKDDATSLLKEIKSVISRLSDNVETGIGKMDNYIKDVAHDVYLSFKNIGEGAIKETKGFTNGFIHELEVAGNYVHKHELQIAEAATISVISPTLMASVAAAAGIVVLSHNMFIKPLEQSTK